MSEEKWPETDEEIEAAMKSIGPIESLDPDFIEKVVASVMRKSALSLNKSEIDQLLSFTISHGVKSPGDVIGKRIIEKFMEMGIVFRDDWENYQLSKYGWEVAREYSPQIGDNH